MFARLSHAQVASFDAKVSKIRFIFAHATPAAAPFVMK